MATITSVRTMPGSTVGRLGWVRTASAQVRRRAAAVGAARHRMRRPALTVAGLTCFDVAAFQASTIVGWCVAGAALLVLEGLSE